GTGEGARGVMRRIAAVAALIALTTPAAQAARPRATLSDLENEVMCVLCKVPLQVAGDAPQAVAERQVLKGLTARGETRAQPRPALVAQYAPQVLATPPAHGFSLSAYVVPIAVVAAALILLALLLPRWRRRARAPSPATGPALDPADARRLDEDL